MERRRVVGAAEPSPSTSLRPRYMLGTGKAAFQLRSMWSIPVFIRLSPLQTLQISTLHEALNCLRTNWPADSSRSSPSYQRALSLCTEAVDGERSPAAARAAFIVAARDAGILGGSSALRSNV